MSPERVHVFQKVQLGVEGTPGSPATANRLMSSLMVVPSIMPDIATYRPSGHLFPTVASLNKEWVEAEVSGPLTYNELVYALGSVLTADTPSGSPAYTWQFAPPTTAAGTPNTYTVEYGDAVRAARFSYGIFTGLTLRFSRDGNELTGTMMGRALTDGISIVGTPTAISMIPITPPQVTVKLADTQAGLTAAPILEEPIEVEWSITNRYGPKWALNGSTDWIAHIEQVPEMSARLVMAADAEGMGPLTNMRANTLKFMRIQATGSSIGTVAPYSLQIDLALLVSDVSDFRDEEGVTAIEWTFTGAHDAATWQKGVQVDLVNTLAGM